MKLFLFLLIPGMLCAQIVSWGPSAGEETPIGFRLINFTDYYFVDAKTNLKMIQDEYNQAAKAVVMVGPVVNITGWLGCYVGAGAYSWAGSQKLALELGIILKNENYYISLGLAKPDQLTAGFGFIINRNKWTR